MKKMFGYSVFLWVAVAVVVVVMLFVVKEYERDRKHVCVKEWKNGIDNKSS